MPSRKLEIEIVGDHSSWSRATKAAIRDSDTLGSRLRGAAKTGALALGGGLVAAAGAAAYGIVRTTQAAEESNKVHAQTAAVLESTGHAAHVSQGDVEALAGAISRKTGIDDEQVQSGANLLLTFTNIRNEVGKGNDIFDQATQTIVDMGAALGQDSKASAIQLGKALNDPIKGITALQRVGVSFSEDKAEQIKQWVEEGEVLRAQKAILRELGTEFGGSAEAQATAVDKIKVSVGNVEESIGGVFLPIVEDAAETLNRDYVPELQRTADTLAAIASRNDIDLEEKLHLSAGAIERQWGDVPGEVGELMQDALPVVAEHAGDLGVAWAKGMLNGFIHADPLGKAAIALLAAKALGGPAALGGIIGLGKRAGSRFGGAAAAEGAAAMAAGFGLSPRAAKAFGLVDRMRSIGATVGKLGLGLGILEGATAAFEDPASDLGGRLEQLQTQGSGLIGTLQGLPGLSSVNALGYSWAEQGDDAKRLEEILRSVNTVHGRQRRLLVQEARELEVQLGLTREQRKEAEKTLRSQTIAKQNLKQGISGLEGGKFTRLTDIKQVIQADMQDIRRTTAAGSQGARDEMARNYRAAVRAIEIGMDRGVIKTRTGMEEIQRLTRQAHLVSGDDPWGIAKGFSRTWERAGGVTRRNIDAITRDLGKMPPASAQMTGQMMLEMARQMRQKGQLSKAEVEKLRSAVVTKLDAMAKQGGRKGDAFATNVGGSFGVLSTQVAEALENIGVNVSTVLRELGAHNPNLQFTLDYFQARGAKGAGKKYLDQVGQLPGNAQGGAVRVPGQGVHDTVPLAVNGALSAVVAPGEDLVVLNRHQRPLVDRALANEYGVAGLPGFFGSFDRPHYMAKGGLHEPRLRGPEPLRGLGQAGIGMGFDAAQEYIRRHRPKRERAGGVPGFVGPPPGMNQLGDNAWVDSHTYAVASYLASKFGSSISSDYRSPSENAAAGGVPNSSHTRGTPANPGAFDFVPPSTAMQAWAGKHIAGLTENMIHDAGSGLHNHIAFFADGGIVLRGPHPGDNRKPSRIYHNYPRFAKWARRHDREKGDGVSWTGVLYDYAENQGVDARKLIDLHGSAALPSQWYEKWYAGKMYAGGGILKGRVTWFNGGETAGGWNTSQPGLALNLDPGTDEGWNNDTTQGWMERAREGKPVYARALIGGKSANLPITDLGPAGWTGNAIDVTEGGVRKLGFTTANFPSGTIGKVEILGEGGGAGGKKAREARRKAEEAQAVGGSIPVQVPPLAPSALLPSAKSLPKNIKKLLRSPGLDYAGRYGISERAIEQAEGTEGYQDDVAAIKFQEELLRRRKQSLRRRLKETDAELRKADSPKHRQALLERRERLIEELGGVQGSLAADRAKLKELRPTAADRADLQLARAELTPDKGDDVAALQHLEELARKELERAEQSGDPREIAEATRNLKAAADALRESTPTAEDFASRDLAMAELTETVEDDKAALEALLSIAEADLAAALATGDPRDDIEAAHRVKQIRDSLKSIEDAVQNSDLSQEVKALREEMEKNRKLSESEAAVSAAVARRALTDMISNELGPRVFHSSQTAGDGTLGVL